MTRRNKYTLKIKFDFDGNHIHPHFDFKTVFPSRDMDGTYLNNLILQINIVDQSRELRAAWFF